MGLSDLVKGRREYLPIAWPANSQLGRPEPMPCKLQALSDADFQEAVAAAHERFRQLKIPHDGMSADDFEGEVSVQVLARALRDHAKPESLSFVTDADDLRRNTSPWERDEVGKLWSAFQERRNPLRALLPEEREQVTAALKKKDAMSLRAFGVDTLVSWLTTTVSPPST